MDNDEVDLKVKELLGIEPNPNTCEVCGSNQYQLNTFECNLLDGNAYCSACHQPIKVGRIHARCLKRKKYTMNTLRRKKR